MDLSVKQLEEAVAVRRQIDQLQNRLSSLLGSSSRGSSSGGSSSAQAESGSASSKGTVKRRRGLSAAGRERIAAAARARWARTKANAAGGSSDSSSSSTKSAKSAKKPGRPAGSGKGKGNGISAAGRKKLSQMMKARWAARRKAQGK